VHRVGLGEAHTEVANHSLIAIFAKQRCGGRQPRRSRWGRDQSSGLPVYLRTTPYGAVQNLAVPRMASSESRGGLVLGPHTLDFVAWRQKRGPAPADPRFADPALVYRSFQREFASVYTSYDFPDAG
jgi:hypothetical protein